MQTYQRMRDASGSCCFPMCNGIFLRLVGCCVPWRLCWQRPSDLAASFGENHPWPHLERGLFLADTAMHECAAAPRQPPRAGAVTLSCIQHGQRSPLSKLALSRQLFRHPSGAVPDLQMRGRRSQQLCCCWMEHPSARISKTDLIDLSADWTGQ